MQTILSSNYWPNLYYMHALLNSTNVCIDIHEHFEKQSFRNRTQILTANGPLSLSVPVKKWRDGCPLKEIEISYAEDWQKQHWRTLISAYKNSPYFDFLEDEIEVFYKTKHTYLYELNQAQITWLMKVLRGKKNYSYSSNYIENKEITDLRNEIHPKKEIANQNIKEKLNIPYYQTFETKFGFTPNLSILDLIFNEGLKAAEYLANN